MSTSVALMTGLSDETYGHQILDVWEYYRIDKEKNETHITVSFDIGVDKRKTLMARRRMAKAHWNGINWTIKNYWA